MSLVYRQRMLTSLTVSRTPHSPDLALPSQGGILMKLAFLG